MSLSFRNTLGQKSGQTRPAGVLRWHRIGWNNANAGGQRLRSYLSLCTRTISQISSSIYEQGIVPGPRYIAQRTSRQDGVEILRLNAPFLKLGAQAVVASFENDGAVWILLIFGEKENRIPEVQYSTCPACPSWSGVLSRCGVQRTVFQGIIRADIKKAPGARKNRMESITHVCARPSVKKAWDLTHHPKKEPTKRPATATTRLTGQRHNVHQRTVPYRMYTHGYLPTDMTPVIVPLVLRPNTGRRAEAESRHTATAEVRKANQAYPPHQTRSALKIARTTMRTLMPSVTCNSSTGLYHDSYGLSVTRHYVVFLLGASLSSAPRIDSTFSGCSQQQDIFTVHKTPCCMKCVLRTDTFELREHNLSHLKNHNESKTVVLDSTFYFSASSVAGMIIRFSRITRSAQHHLLAFDRLSANQFTEATCQQGYAALDVWYCRLHPRPIGKRSQTLTCSWWTRWSSSVR